MIAPRRRASSVTWWPIRVGSGCSSSSMPTMNPQRRTSRTAGCARDRLEQLAEQRDLRLQPLERALLAEHVERRDRRRRRRAGCPCRCGRGRTCGTPRARRGSPRRSRSLASVAASGRYPPVMPLARQIRSGATPSWSHANMRAGAAEAGGHLVEDQQHAVPVAQVAHRAQVAGRVREHAGGALHERLHDHRRHLALGARRAGAPCRRRRPARPSACRTGAGGRSSGRGRCRRPTRSRSCRRGRPSSATRTRRRSSPRWRQYWNAIFSAISVAVEPESE